MPKKGEKREINWQEAGPLKEGQVPQWANNLRKYVFKEIPELTFCTPYDGQEEELADASLYGLWYRFLRANKAEYPPPKDLDRHHSRAAFYRKFGDLQANFSEWWGLRGRELFKEETAYPFVRVLKQNRPHRNYDHHPLDGFELRFDEAINFELKLEQERLAEDIRPQTGELRSIIVEIPMTISRELILQQLGEVLKALHPGDKLLRHEYSTASLRLEPKRRYEHHYYEKLLAVWVFHEKSTEDETWWQIGEKAMVDPALSPELSKDPRDRAANQEALGRITELLYRKAEMMMANAIRGKFPSDKKHKDIDYS